MLNPLKVPTRSGVFKVIYDQLLLYCKTVLFNGKCRIALRNSLRCKGVIALITE